MRSKTRLIGTAGCDRHGMKRHLGAKCATSSPDRPQGVGLTCFAVCCSGRRPVPRRTMVQHLASGSIMLGASFSRHPGRYEYLAVDANAEENRHGTRQEWQPRGAWGAVARRQGAIGRPKFRDRNPDARFHAGGGRAYDGPPLVESRDGVCQWAAARQGTGPSLSHTHTGDGDASVI
jgi:hypothetical protein